MIGIYSHVGDVVLREMNDLRITIGSEVNSAKILFHNLSEDPLVVADHHEFAGRLTFWRISGVLGIVVQDLRSVRIQTPASQGIFQPQFMIQSVDRRADPLHRDTRLPNAARA